MAIIIEDLVQNELDSEAAPRWNKIDLENIFVSHQFFIFHQHSFYFRMLHKTVNTLIDTGIMNHLINNHLRQNKFVKVEEHAKVLNIKDLSYGFNIWLCCCSISIIAFIMEFVYKLNVPTVKKVKFAKVHPDEKSVENLKLVHEISKETIKKFKIKQIQSNDKKLSLAVESKVSKNRVPNSQNLTSSVMTTKNDEIPGSISEI
jgi:hypothetical protein